MNLRGAFQQNLTSPNIPSLKSVLHYDILIIQVSRLFGEILHKAALLPTCSAKIRGSTCGNLADSGMGVLAQPICWYYLIVDQYRSYKPGIGISTGR